MNAKVVVVLVGLLLVAGSLLVVALTGSARELTVGDIVTGEWPPEGVDAQRVAATEVLVVGYCVEVDRALNPSMIRIANRPPGEAGFGQPALTVDIQSGAMLPDEVRLRAWTRVRGTYDPASGRFRASRVEMKCPSAEEERAAPAVTATQP